MLRRLPQAAAVLLCLATAGCHSPLKLNEIALRVTGVRQTPSGVTLALDYDNSNATQLVVTRSAHELWLDGKAVGEIESGAPVGLPMFARAAQQVAVPPDVAGKILAVFAGKTGAVDYRIRSRCDVTIRFEEDVLRASGSGTVSLEKE